MRGVSPKALHTVHRAHRRSTGSSMRGTLPRALHRATRETGSTQKQESVTVVFLSRAARLEDFDGSRAAPVGTHEVVLARQWGFVLVVFQCSFVLLWIIGELASAACVNLAPEFGRMPFYD